MFKLNASSAVWLRVMVLLGVSCLALLSACSTTKVQATWQTEDFNKGDIKQILVVAKADQVTTRAIFEAAYVHELKAKGYQAISSYEAMQTEKIDKDEIRKYLRDNGIAHVMLIRLAKIDTEREYIKPKQVTYYTPSSMYYQPNYYYGHHYYGRYHSYGSFYDHWDYGTTLTYEGRWEERTATILETLIYQTSDEQLVWVASSRSYEAYNAMDASKEVSKKVLGEL